MNNQRPVVLILLIVYIFGPTLLDWVIAPGATWYKPYLIWAIVIIVALALQLGRKHHDA